MGVQDEGRLALGRIELAHQDAAADIRTLKACYAGLQLQLQASQQREAEWVRDNAALRKRAVEAEEALAEAEREHVEALKAISAEWTAERERSGQGGSR